MIAGNGQVAPEPLQPRAGDKWVFHREHAANAAACAGVKLNKIDIVKLFILQLFKHFDHILRAVRSKVTVAQERRRFPAAAGPAHADEPD